MAIYGIGLVFSPLFFLKTKPCTFLLIYVSVRDGGSIVTRKLWSRMFLIDERFLIHFFIIVSSVYDNISFRLHRLLLWLSSFVTYLT